MKVSETNYEEAAKHIITSTPHYFKFENVTNKKFEYYRLFIKSKKQ